MRRYNVFIDGCCLNVQDKELAVGGWGFVIVDTKDNKIIHESYGKLRNGAQNSTRSELEALCQVLRWINKNDNKNTLYHFYSDYKAMIDCVAGSSKRIAHREFWDEIEQILLKIVGRTQMSHVISHQLDGDEISQLNNYVDKLAKTGANSLLIAPVA